MTPPPCPTEEAKYQVKLACFLLGVAVSAAARISVEMSRPEGGGAPALDLGSMSLTLLVISVQLGLLTVQLGTVFVFFRGSPSSLKWWVRALRLCNRINVNLLIAAAVARSLKNMKQ